MGLTSTMERSLVATLVQEPGCRAAVMRAGLRGRHLADAALGDAYEAIVRSRTEGVELLVSLRQELGEEAMRAALGCAYDAELLGTVGVARVAGELLADAGRRELGRLQQQRAAALRGAAVTIDGVHASVEELGAEGVLALCSRAERRIVEWMRGRGEVVSPAAAWGATMDAMEEGDGQRPPLSTPWPAVTDQLAGGYRMGQVALLGGRPGAGKTAAASQLAAHWLDAERPGVVVSCEMTATEWHQRWLAQRSDVPYGRILSGDLLQTHWDALAAVREEAERWPYAFAAPTRPTVMDLLVLAERCAAEHGSCDWMVVDYLTRCGLDSVPGETQAQRVTGYVEAVQDELAKPLGVSVMLLHQLNRHQERAGAAPTMADFRGGGEEPAAVAQILTAAPRRELHTVKARYGQVGMVPMTMDGMALHEGAVELL